MKMSRDLARQFDSLWGCGLGDLVPCGVHDDRRTVAVLSDHAVRVLAPRLVEAVGCVVRGLRRHPVVGELLDHVHAELVAGVEQVS